MQSCATPKKIVKYPKYKLIDFHMYDEEDHAAIANDPPKLDQHGNEISRRAPLNFVIQMFGIDKMGKTASIYIKDYKPFFYIKVNYLWNDSTLLDLKREILSKIGKHNEKNIVEMKIVDCNKLYGFTAGRTNKFVMISFKNMKTFGTVRDLWYNKVGRDKHVKSFVFQRTRLEIYESSIPPILRYFHIHNISPSGWVLVRKAEEGDSNKQTTCTKEYVCNWKDIEPLPNEEAMVPYKICSFDIEASSSHGDFPIPIKTYKRLASNLVDYFYKSDLISNSGKMTLEEKEKLFYEIILSAYGLTDAAIDGIDSVYPKENHMNKKNMISHINMLIDIVMELDETEYLKGSAYGATFDKTKLKKSMNILKIDEFFENMNSKYYGGDDGEENMGAGAGIDDDVDVDVDVDVDADADAVDAPADGDVIEEEDSDEYDEYGNSIENSLDESTATTSSVKKHVRYAKNVEKTNISLVQWIILNSVYDRDKKIELLNEILTLYLPELEGDKVTFIGSTFMRYGEKQPYLNNCIVLGTCDDVENATIECMETERDVLVRWAELIQEENPDIIIGYNIFGFDYEFMFRRAQETDCVNEFFDLSRRKNELCCTRARETGDVSIANSTIQISTGEYNLKYFKMPGRIQIDMYTYFRREFNLSSYKLDDVASQNISDDIRRQELVYDLDNPEEGKQTYLYSSNLTGLHIGDFIHIELSSFTSDYYEDGKKFCVVDIKTGVEVVEMAKGKETKVKYNVIVIDGHYDLSPATIGVGKTVKWGMAKDDVTPQDIFRLSKGTAEDRAIVAKYCIQDCNLVHHLMNKIDVLTGYVEMARICSVPISFLVFRGQGIKLTSFVAKKCREKNTLMPDLDKSGANEGYEGAIVLPPKCSMYMDNPVACVDYSSLYPSSMISNNLSHDSKVWTREYDLDGNLIKETGEKDKSGVYVYDNLPYYEYIDIEFDTYRYIKKNLVAKAVKTKAGKMICRWAQFPENKKGIMPSILEELLKARSDTRKMAKGEKDPFMANILDKRQLGYKVTANSLYGQCGAKTSTFYEKDVAASTTATGRQMIIYARRIIEEVYGDLEYETESHGKVLSKAEYVYGDTDSVFFTFNLVDPLTKEKIRGQKALEITIEIAQDAAQLCTQYLKPPMELSYEKTLMPFILLSKKRYVGMLYETDPTKGKMKYMGLSIKRRDSCDYLKDTYGGILNILMKEYNVQKAIVYLESALDNLIAGQVPLEKLLITRALKGYYKKPLQIAHNVLAERMGKRDPGNKPKSGDRIKFVFVNNEKAKLLGDKIETPEFVLSNGAEINYAYYITNQLMKPLQQLFGLALEQIWESEHKLSAIKEFNREVANLKKQYPDLEIFMKKREKLTSQKIKNLLFNKYITKIELKKQKMKQITTFFAPKPGIGSK